MVLTNATACAIITKDFDLNDKQKNIIRSHMFPATLLHPPRSIEAVIICLSDKICAVTEYAGLYYPYEESFSLHTISEIMKQGNITGLLKSGGHHDALWGYW